MQKEYDLPGSHALHYEQVTSYWKQTRLQPNQIFKPSFVERLVTSQCYSISRSYPLIQAHALKPLQYTPVAHWIKDIPELESTDNLLTGHMTILRHVMSENWKETQIKLFHRAYSTYFKDPISNTQSSTANTCPKCAFPRPTLTCLLWKCSHIQIFWTLVNNYVSRLTKWKIPLTPLIHLFGIKPFAQGTWDRPRSSVPPFASSSLKNASCCTG